LVVILQLLQQQQKNTMEQVGHKSCKFGNSKKLLAGAGTQTAALGFGGDPPLTAATEEWTGAGAPTTVTITAS
jgi:hypothetical protein